MLLTVDLGKLVMNFVMSFFSVSVCLKSIAMLSGIVQMGESSCRFKSTLDAESTLYT